LIVLFHVQLKLPDKKISKFIYLRANLVFYVKKSTIALLSAVFVALIAGSVQSISADHLEPGQGLFSGEDEVKLVTTEGTKYQVHLQTVVRTGDGQLISIDEEPAAAYIPNEISDYVFDTLMGEKEIVIIDNIKYEKVQYTFTPTFKQRWVGLYQINPEPVVDLIMEGDVLERAKMKDKHYSIWKIHGCWDFVSMGHPGIQCIPIFQVLVPTTTLEPTDVVTQQWTVLRVMN